MIKSKKTSETSIKDQVYDKIRAEIISFGLKPGAQISESQLATRFGVGIASIRAVLPKLVQEGFLINTKSRRHGHVVRPITVKDVIEVYQLREILEVAAAELAVGNVDVAMLERLDAQSAASKGSVAAKAGGTSQIQFDSLAANREFHTAIALASGNERLGEMIGRLHDHSIRFQYLLRRSAKAGREWGHSHESIIKALKAGDSAAAGKAMRAHIRRGKDLTLAELIELPEFKSLNIGSLAPAE